MRLVDIKAITVPENRQRREFKESKIQDLCNSIMTSGLLHPPVVTDNLDGTYTLRAGERRLRALILVSVSFYLCNGQQVPRGQVPVTLTSAIGEEELAELELCENVCREDLTWQERVRAESALNDLRKSQAEAKGVKHTVKDLADEILGDLAGGKRTADLGDNLIIAQHLDDPDVVKASSRKEALKVVTKKLALAHHTKLLESTPLTPHSIYHGSVFDIAPTLPSGTFDVIISDPPYGIDAQDFGSMATTAHKYVDSAENALAIYNTIAVEGFRLCKPQAFAYVFCDLRHFAHISTLFVGAGWSVWGTPLIWNKLNGMVPDPLRGYRRSYECILMANKGGKALQKIVNDVWTVSPVRSKLHGAQKPVQLFIDILQTCTLPGDSVIDFCAGSGPIFPAANTLKLRATGIEIEEQWYKLAASRLDSIGELDDIS